MRTYYLILYRCFMVAKCCHIIPHQWGNDGPGIPKWLPAQGQTASQRERAIAWPGQRVSLLPVNFMSQAKSLKRNAHLGKRNSFQNGTWQKAAVIKRDQGKAQRSTMSQLSTLARTGTSSHLNLSVSQTKKEGSRPQDRLQLVSTQRREPLPGLTFILLHRFPPKCNGLSRMSVSDCGVLSVGNS